MASTKHVIVIVSVVVVAVACVPFCPFELSEPVTEVFHSLTDSAVCAVAAVVSLVQAVVRVLLLPLHVVHFLLLQALSLQNYGQAADVSASFHVPTMQQPTHNDTLSTNHTTSSLSSMFFSSPYKGRVFLVTGASSGLGKEIAALGVKQIQAYGFLGWRFVGKDIRAALAFFKPTGACHH